MSADQSTDYLNFLVQLMGAGGTVALLGLIGRWWAKRQEREEAKAQAENARIQRLEEELRESRERDRERAERLEAELAKTKTLLFEQLTGGAARSERMGTVIRQLGQAVDQESDELQAAMSSRRPPPVTQQQKKTR